MGTGDILLQVFGVLGAGGILAAIVQAFFGRKKMSADVVKTINEAAGGIVERVEADNARLRAKNEELERRVNECTEHSRHAESRSWSAERRAEKLAETLLDYVSYCGRQTDVIRSLGGEIDDPPGIPDDILRIITAPPGAADPF